MLAGAISLILAIGFAFAYVLEKERNAKILKSLPNNIKRIYLVRHKL